MSEPVMESVAPPPWTKRTEHPLCVTAYESLDPKTRYDPSNPKTPLYDLESIYQDKNDSSKYKIFSKYFIRKYLNVNNPFQLLTHNPETILTKEKLNEAKECIWKRYYAPVVMRLKQNSIEKLRKKQNSKVIDDDFNKYFDVQRGYLDFKTAQQSFEKFVEYVFNAPDLQITNDSILKQCSSLMNPTDVFSPCKIHCIDEQRTGEKKSLKQPRLLQEELTKFDTTLKDMYSHLMKQLEVTKSELEEALASETPKVHPKRIKDVLDEKFGRITHVPDFYDKFGTNLMKELKKISNSKNSTNSKNRVRKYEAEKKRKQGLQTKLIKTVINDKGYLKSKYSNLFALETPFDLTTKGQKLSKNGGLRTAYGRDEKRIELHLKFKANQALKNTRNLIKKAGNKTNTKEFKNLSNKAELLKVLVDKPHANKPLKLVRNKTMKGTIKTTVAAGGDRARRKLISLFGIKEFKDKLDGFKQKYTLTNKSEKMLDYPTRFYGLRVNNQNHPVVGDFKYFEKKELEKTVEKLFLNYLYLKMRGKPEDTVFDLGELKKYEKIDIPHVNTFKLQFNEDFYEFEPHNGKFKLKFKRSGNFTNLISLTYRMSTNGPFVKYDEAVRLARLKIRSEPGTIFQKNDIARFYLRNEDRYRMEPIENILKVTDLHKAPTSKSPSKHR